MTEDDNFDVWNILVRVTGTGTTGDKAECGLYR